ncbi:MAG: lipid asymmetry maintenance ABC transporter permease subunit MlaE [Gammaproteobacteria bacterium]|nr:lipid asymmetry maintenance ABC transporter permease subunit MlaE [Gammaproteobacteria bacterium]
MIDHFERLGSRTISAVQTFGQSGFFLLRIIFQRPHMARFWPALCDQLYFVGVLSFLIVVVSGLFIGMVVGLQGFHILQKFGAVSQVGQLLALSITRELGPVLTALLFAGRAGSALTAEIGLMKATEQLASMDMMGVDPLRRIIYPRFWAGMIALPVLGLIFSMVAVYGGYWTSVQWLGVDAGSFWSNMQGAVDFHMDVVSGVVKSIVFAFLVIWIALFQGFTCEPTAEGISQATTRTVVCGSLAVLGFDFLLTAMMIGGW